MTSPDSWLDDRYRVDTPERLDLEYDVAGLGSRFLAAVIDLFLQSITASIVFFLGTLGVSFGLGVLTPLLGRDLGSATSFVPVAITLLLTFLVVWGYHIFFEMVWNGQTPGKRWLGLRVIKDGGYPVGFVDSLIRNIVRIVDFLPFNYSLGAIVMFLDRRSRRLGDLAAGTLVVKERRDLRVDKLLLGGSSGLKATPSTSPEVESGLSNLHRLTADDQTLLREYFLRRQSLDGRASAALASRLATAFARKLEHDLVDEAPAVFLERLAKQLSEGQRVE